MSNKPKTHINLYNRKLIQLIKNFKEAEIIELLLYLEAPHLGLDKLEVGFFRFLTRNHPNYEEFPVSSLSKFFEGDEKRLKIQFTKTVHRLFKWTENWLLYKEVDKNPLLRNQLLVKVYAEYAEPKRFFQFAEATQKAVKENNSGHPDYFHAQFKIDSNLFHYPNTNRYKNENQLSELSGQLDSYFIAQKLRLICQQMSRSRLLNEKMDISFFQEVLDYAKRFPANQYFQLYLKLIQLFQKHDDQLLWNIKKQFEKHLHIFNRLELGIFLNLLINYVILLTNIRRKEYLELQFELYKLKVKKGLIIFNNRITDETFHNILHAACHVKDFVYAKKFLKMHKIYLELGDESQLIPLSEGFIAFHQKQFDKCGKKIDKLFFKKLNFNLTHRALLIRCYYEMFLKEEFFHSTFDNYTKNFGRFVRNKKDFASSKKQPYLNFIKTVLKFPKIKNEASTQKKRQKMQKLNEYLEIRTTKIISKNWLLEKIKEL